MKDSKRDTGALNPQQMAQRLAVEQNVINSLKLHEAWDILDAMKKLVMEDSRGTKVRNLLEAHPQIIHAIYEIEVSSFLSLLSSLSFCMTTAPAETTRHRPARPPAAAASAWPGRSGGSLPELHHDLLGHASLPWHWGRRLSDGGRRCLRNWPGR